MRHPPKLTLDRILPLVARYYADNPAGGSLHIVLDDGNLQESFIRSCIRFARNDDDTVGWALGELLLLLTPSQRRRLYASVYRLSYP